MHRLPQFTETAHNKNMNNIRTCIKSINCRVAALNLIEYISNKYFTYHLRPKLASENNSVADSLIVHPKVLIIIQGPLLRKDQFTLETIRLYKKIYSNCKILLSTWDDEDPEYLRKIRCENIEIILNMKPPRPGIANINYQVTSTLSATKRAKELDFDFILKTRTDLRIYNPNAIDFLVNLIKVFPSDNPRQKMRLAFPSLNTFKYRPYSLTDQVMFGRTDDVIKYWEIDQDIREIYPPNKTVGDWSKARLAEVYLSANYLENIGHEMSWTIADSWYCYSKFFCIFDSQSIDIYWHKYAREREYRRLEYKVIRNDQEMSFLEWINIYANLNNKKSTSEHILNTYFYDTISNQQKPSIDKI